MTKNSRNLGFHQKRETDSSGFTKKTPKRTILSKNTASTNFHREIKEAANKILTRRP